MMYLDHHKETAEIQDIQTSPEIPKYEVICLYPAGGELIAA